ncbi:hypothetical protein F6Y03_30995 [Bacillus megaterium]|nr:hypothetical protein [Priestia megaterium]NGY84950.1 hypothetical protein [Priestia megaterium]
MKKLKYEGSLPEVELLMTGKRFKKGIEVIVTDEEYNALKNHKDFKLVKPKKEGAK